MHVYVVAMDGGPGIGLRYRFFKKQTTAHSVAKQTWESTRNIQRVATYRWVVVNDIEGVIGMLSQKLDLYLEREELLWEWSEQHPRGIQVNK